MPQGPIAVAMTANDGGVATPATINDEGALVVGSGGVAQALALSTFMGTSLDGTAAGVVTTVGLATTYTGLCLSNPAGSGKDVVVKKITAGLNVVTAAPTVIGLIQGYSAAGVVTHTTPATVFNGLPGGSVAAAVAKLDKACTLVGTPAWREFLFGTAIAAGAGQASRQFDNLVIPPGGYIALGTNIASPAAGLVASFEWTEQDIAA